LLTAKFSMQSILHLLEKAVNKRVFNTYESKIKILK